MDVTPQEKVLGMDDMILIIYGFVLGTDMNKIVYSMDEKELY